MFGNWSLRGIAAAAGLLVLSGFVFAQDAPRKVRIVVDEDVVVPAPPVAGGVVRAVRVGEAAEAALSKYWIGVGCAPLTDVLKAQLHLERGVVVEVVVEKSPAAAAELAVHDILLAVDDYDLNSVDDLVAAVDKVGDKEATLRVIRSGQEKSIKITPQARPQSETLDEEQRVLRAVERVRTERLKAGEPAWEMMLLKPGAVVPFNPAETLKLPDNVSITVRKQADKPAQIEIDRGDDKWTVAEDKLDELPPDLQAFVRKLLARHPHAGGAVFAMPHGVQATPALPTLPPQVKVTKPLVTPASPDAQAVMKKLEEVLDAVRAKPAINVDALEQEVDRLRRDVEELKKTLQKQP